MKLEPSGAGGSDLLVMEGRAKTNWMTDGTEYGFTRLDWTGLDWIGLDWCWKSGHTHTQRFLAIAEPLSLPVPMPVQSSVLT